MAATHTHLVQFYNNDCFLADSVGAYIGKVLAKGEGAVIIATSAHAELFAKYLAGTGVDPGAAERSKRLQFRDARATLSLFMDSDRPDWDRFEGAIGPIVSQAAGVSGVRGVHAYGEMVGLLWQEGRMAAAIELEEYWNKLLGACGCKLFCGYPIDVFGSMFEMSSIDSVLCAHTQLLPTDAAGDLDRALERSMSEILGSKVEGLKLLMNANFRPAWAAVPRAESTILWLRRNLPSHAEQIMDRARLYCGQGEVAFHA